ncbi:hypothetical protein F7725_022502 [Dissostichus mawsoni]|uniref:Uncharacterized protein n=1 Tax=Dissostichus mawsoni TaxID=36200 RepID=A0A7J5Z107_DISMA|nr:hypothetical protein F7725_022502 [Dissostichus mawsoni]
MKMAAPGLSCQAFLRMLDQRTLRFGRAGKISADSFHKRFFEWEAVRFEVDNIVKEERFICPACSPDMLAVLVDGNRKHYRFKNSARSEEQAIFEGVFISKDEDVAKCVDYTHSTTKHVSGRGVCGGEWSAARETSKRSTSKLDEEGLELASAALCTEYVQGRNLCLVLARKAGQQEYNFFCMDVTCKYWPYLQKVTKSCPELQHLLQMRPFLSVFHAKAHDFKCEVRKHHVKWSGAYQDGAGLTHGEEVEQCNAFLSRIAVTTKHMSKAGRTDMLTLLTTKDLQSQMQALETMKAQLAVTESQLEDWVNDVKEWAEDGNKARARIRCKIRKEKEILTSVVASYNSMVPSTETLCLENILSEEENAWPWQLPHSGISREGHLRIRRLQEEKKIVLIEMDHHWRAVKTRVDGLKELSCLLSSETIQRLRGLQSTILRKRQNITERKLQARACYLQVLSGAENVNFLHRASADDYDSDSDSNMD